MLILSAILMIRRTRFRLLGGAKLIEQRTKRMLTSYLNFSGRSQQSISADEYLSFRKQAVEEEMYGLSSETKTTPVANVQENTPVVNVQENTREIPSTTTRQKEVSSQESKVVSIKEPTIYHSVKEADEETSNKEKELLNIMKAIEG